MPSDQKPTWKPPVTLEERVRGVLIPPRAYYWLRARRELRRGEAELKILPHLIDRARVSIDAGANKGVYTYWLERLSHHVHAFEPNPKMFRLLQTGAGTKATVHNAALSDATGTAKLRIPETARGRFSNQGASLNHDKVGDSYGEVEVKTLKLDDAKINDIGFIKIDVEGHEMAVLDGAREVIRRDRPVLLIEMEERHTGCPIEDDLATVVALDYRALFLQDGVLTDISRFDAQAQHRAQVGKPGYVFNFIFLPIERDA